MDFTAYNPSTGEVLFTGTATDPAAIAEPSIGIISGQRAADEERVDLTAVPPAIVPRLSMGNVFPNGLNLFSGQDLDVTLPTACVVEIDGVVVGTLAAGPRTIHFAQAGDYALLLEPLNRNYRDQRATVSVI